MSHTMQFVGPPSALAYHLRSFMPSIGSRSRGAFPPLRAIWDGFRVSSTRLTAAAKMGLLPESAAWDILVPQVFAFRLQMAIVTHPAFPFAIWRALQVHNSYERHGPTPLDEPLRAETNVGGHRVLYKGVEVDLITTVQRGTEVCWRGLTTFYYRGRAINSGPAASEPRKAPEVAGETVADWIAEQGNSRHFAALSGDYNGIHQWPWYARRFGFRRAFFHPQRILAHAMAHLPSRPSGERQCLDVWLKGPVYYGASVALKTSQGATGLAFAVHADGEPRPAIVAQWRNGDSDCVATGPYCAESVISTIAKVQAESGI